MGDRTKVGHSDLSLFLSGQELHNRRLDQGNQGHIGISGYGYGTEEVGSQLGSEVNRGGSVSAADDADGSCFLDIEAQDHSTCQCHKYADLGSST